MSRPFERESTPDIEARSTMSAFVPLLILALAMAAWFGFQAMQLNAEREAVRGLMTGQDKQIEESRKLRDSLDAIARGTAKLSDAGNPNAQLVIEELKKRGVVVNPTATSKSGAEMPPGQAIATPATSK